MVRIPRLTVDGVPAVSHVISRTAADGFVLWEAEKEYPLTSLVDKKGKRYAAIINDWDEVAEEKGGWNALPVSESDLTPVHPLLHLPQTIGNQAMGRLLQAKLQVGQPGDQFEHEADRAAEHTVSTPDSQASQSTSNPGNVLGSSVQRKPETEDDTRLLQNPHETDDQATTRPTPEELDDAEARMHRLAETGRPSRPQASLLVKYRSRQRCSLGL